MTSAADLPVDLDDAQQEILELRQALRSRSVIDQAKGLAQKVGDAVGSAVETVIPPSNEPRT